MSEFVIDDWKLKARTVVKLYRKDQGRFYVGAGGGHRPPQMLARPPPNILVPTAKIRIVKI